MMSNIQEGAQSDSIKDYKLPVIDTQKQKRNFPGYKEEQWVTLDEWRQGDWAGSTDTDSQTDDRQDNPRYKIKYTKLNKKAGPKMRGFKTSSPRTKDN